MPIASGNNPRIVLDAYMDNSEFDKNAAALQARIQAVSEKLKQQGETSAAAAKQSTMSWTDFRSMYSTVLDVIRVGQQVFDATVGKAQEYDQTIRDVMLSTGATAEESSRLVQVVDDAGVSYGTLKTALKMASKEGIEPNIESLKKLSDQYLTLAPGVERNQFLLDKFGKSGLDMARVMELGSDAIQEMNDGIGDGLVLTQDAIDESEEYRKNVDELKDSWDAFVITLGNKAIPAMNDTIESQREWSEAMDEAAQKTGSTNQYVLKHEAALIFEREAAIEAAQALSDHAEALDGVLTPALETATEATYDLTTSNEDFLNMVESVGGKIEDFEGKQEELTGKRLELEAEKQALLAQGYGAESAQIQEINGKIDENNAKYAENAAAFEVENKKIMLGYIERKLTADGILDDRELVWLTEKGVAWGVYHETAVAEVQAMIDEANGLIEGLITEKTFTLSLNAIYSGGGDSGGRVVGGPRAEGGPVSGGMMYPVNERGMPELLNFGGKQMLMMPERGDGYVTPLSGGAGGTGTGGATIINILLDSATPDPERVAYQLGPAVERVLRNKKLI